MHFMAFIDFYGTDLGWGLAGSIWMDKFCIQYFVHLCIVMYYHG